MTVRPPKVVPTAAAAAAAAAGEGELAIGGGGGGVDDPMVEDAAVLKVGVV